MAYGVHCNQECSIVAKTARLRATEVPMIREIVRMGDPRLQRAARAVDPTAFNTPERDSDFLFGHRGFNHRPAARNNLRNSRPGRLRNGSLTTTLPLNALSSAGPTGASSSMSRMA